MKSFTWLSDPRRCSSTTAPPISHSISDMTTRSRSIGGPDPFTLYNYDNHQITSCENLTTGASWTGCQYASHAGPPWQFSAFAFTVGNLDNGYASNPDRRLILGPTFQPDTSGCTWFNFGADSNERNVTNIWTSSTQNRGSFYLR